MKRLAGTVVAVGIVGLVVWNVVSHVNASPPAVETVIAEPQAKPSFDSAKAFEHLKAMVAIGPRYSGSPAIRQTRAYLTRELSALGFKVEEQPFTADTPKGRIEMVNLIVRLAGKRPERLLFTGHYDTKNLPNFVGASDGGSSAAFLVELARALKDQPREFTYEFVWLDGEEATCNLWDECSKPGKPDHTYGSQYYVDAAKQAGALKSIKAMILVDMIGDKDLQIRRERKGTAWITDAIWAAAKRTGHGGTFVDLSTDIEDDHVPFINAGVEAADIIDLDYPYWHNDQACCDDISRVSARSLQIVGEVLLAAIPDIEKRLAR